MPQQKGIKRFKKSGINGQLKGYGQGIWSKSPQFDCIFFSANQLVALVGNAFPASKIIVIWQIFSVFQCQPLGSQHCEKIAGPRDCGDGVQWLAHQTVQRHPRPV